MTIDATKYPMHAKLQPLQPLSQAVYDFLEWCDEERIQLAKYENDTEMMFPVYEDRAALLARHFGINLSVLEGEKRAMLDEIRASHAKE